MWALTMGLAIGVLGISVLTARRRRDGRYTELGWMSQQWLTEHRAGRH